jgi:glycosyltransferase involved in cell wall biosynthesis
MKYEIFHERRREFPFVEEGGEVPPERVPAELAAAALALNVSHSENAAHAVLEAMALGRPVLAADIPGNRELIRFDPDRPERSTGILYRAAPTPDPRRRHHDAADFRRLARLLLADPALRAAIGRNARDHIARAHPPEAEIDALLAAYRRALG